MPRKARVDAPGAGAFHNIICRGIERRRILYDDADRDKFLERPGEIFIDSSTSCYGWAVMPYHRYGENYRCRHISPLFCPSPFADRLTLFVSGGRFYRQKTIEIKTRKNPTQKEAIPE